MSIITYKEAIRQAMIEKMREDDKVFLMGEDIGVYGGAFGVSMGMLEEFGPKRILETPMSEASFTGVGVGAAILGMRPIVEIMFADFLTFSADQFVNQAAKLRYMTGGQLKIPLVIRAPQGSGTGAAAQHSQNVEAWFFNIPGIKIVAPSNAYDAKGLLKSSIEDDNPILFLEHKLLYNTKGEIPDSDYRVPIGKSKIVKEGKDITVVASSIEVKRSLDAASTLNNEGIYPEIIDIRTIKPLDVEPIINSVKKTHRLLVVHEGCLTGGIGGEIVARIAESDAFLYLDAPIFRLGGADTPIPYNRNLEKYAVPQTSDIENKTRKILKEEWNA
jgi:pyruvate/2-oxoglutarate/acetoin dehydrogenase E1 component